MEKRSQGGGPEEASEKEKSGSPGCSLKCGASGGWQGEKGKGLSAARSGVLQGFGGKETHHTIRK